jgi:hypothetical protein
MTNKKHINEYVHNRTAKMYKWSKTLMDIYDDSTVFKQIGMKGKKNVCVYASVG